MQVKLVKGDATKPWLVPDNHFDSMVTDPPYGINFMGKNWDDKSKYVPVTKPGETALAACKLLSYEPWQAGFVAFTADWASQAHRCLKPGAFLLAFAGTKASDLLTMGLRAAGFEILDGIEWLYLSGFPKAQDIGKMFDKRRKDHIDHVCSFLRRAMDAIGVSSRQIGECFGLNPRQVDQWAPRPTDNSSIQRAHVPTWDQWLQLKGLLDFSDEMDAEVWRLNGRKGTPGEAFLEREVIEERVMVQGGGNSLQMRTGERREVQADITAPATDLAKKWDGWKTPALKPAHEPIIVAQKPFSGTYCDNIERWGVGAINVDGCRVGTEKVESGRAGRSGKVGNGFRWDVTTEKKYVEGRFPANVVMSHGPDCTPEACQEGCPVKALDEQSGILKSGARAAGVRKGMGYHGADGDGGPAIEANEGPASRIFPRFFYEDADFVPFRYNPKASRSEKEIGLDHLPKRTVVSHNIEGRDEGNPKNYLGSYTREDGTEFIPAPKANTHPTVKPLGLMRWLQRLVTPPGGLTASPFLGSGTDAVAAIYEGFDFWGMNLPDQPGTEYWPIIDARVAHALRKVGAAAQLPVSIGARRPLPASDVAPAASPGFKRPPRKVVP